MQQLAKSASQQFLLRDGGESAQSTPWNGGRGAYPGPLRALSARHGDGLGVASIWSHQATTHSCARDDTSKENSEQTVQRPAVYVSDAHELWMGTFTPEEQTSRALRRATHLELDINRATEGLEGLS